MNPADPILNAFLATVFTWLMTLAGAALVFLPVRAERKLLDSSLGFAAGIMIAASFWSLLVPAIELSALNGYAEWLPPALGFLAGGLFLSGVDKIIPHLHPGCDPEDAEGPPTTWRRNRLLLLAVAIHNIPEGLAVGVAFGAAAATGELAAPITLTLGIGIQNLPEGAAVSLPLRGEGLSRWRSFTYGQVSGLVEILGGVAGAILVYSFSWVMPYALGFAAGAMIFVVIEDIIPECQSGGNTDLATVSALLGFVLMMILDLALS
ncbi:ZIP family metal transporter [Methanothermobacter sp. K4]|uniref:ZIP family metal transporter n=1 Tax=Methanothermobacter sp. K4 TaxID=2913262 RepID=UPI001EDC3580|nr:ZIP family metal transporter [Methanothermobacter sp. K4]MCG2828471.1 ZIP family metal transporter [Methanothermobacter sp. K4]